jgi:transposase
MDKTREVTLTVREQKRLFVITEVVAGRWTAAEGAEKLGLSLRQMRRLLAACRRDGPSALVHGNRGRATARRLSPGLREQVVGLVKSSYSDYNDYHLAEILAEEHDIILSRSSVRRIRRGAGVPGPRKRRSPRHRSQRPRSARRGMLLQIDGSDHAWLENRGPKLSLLAAIDDATGEVVWAVFRPEEDAVGYFLLLQHILQTHGLPEAVYADRHTIFQSPKKATIAEELAGKLPRSQFGRLLDELDILLIKAHSPQAKGRIERLFGTLQDRLVKALRQAGATSLEEANQVLPGFLSRFNARFAVPPAEEPSAYRPWPTGLKPEDVLCFKHERVVANDNAISFSGQRLSIEPGSPRRSYARCRVEVRQLLNGQLLVSYQGKPIARFKPLLAGPPTLAKFTPADPQPVRVRITPTSRKRPARKSQQPYKPPPDHPWRKPFLIQGKPKKTEG